MSLTDRLIEKAPSSIVHSSGCHGTVLQIIEDGGAQAWIGAMAQRTRIWGQEVRPEEVQYSSQRIRTGGDVGSFDGNYASPRLECRRLETGHIGAGYAHDSSAPSAGSANDAWLSDRSTAPETRTRRLSRRH